jgi:hypothetical protein
LERYEAHTENSNSGIIMNVDGANMSKLLRNSSQ